ncbi:VOC family protein [Ectothiorhodospiraceae bacterium 2226]|nr:VOC family protein [Ectothiorhodospiraceae bacterium 2226]
MIEPNNSFPVFIVTDLGAARAFYTGHFGFTPVFANDWYLHLVSRSGVQLGFLLPEQPTQPPIFHTAYSGNGAIFSLEVDDAEAAYAYAQEAGLNIVLALRSEDWGQRHFCARDPNGVHLDIVQATAPSAEYRGDYAT